MIHYSTDGEDFHQDACSSPWPSLDLGCSIGPEHVVSHGPSCSIAKTRSDPEGLLPMAPFLLLEARNWKILELVEDLYIYEY
jgi:hypothetical protein